MAIFLFGFLFGAVVGLHTQLAAFLVTWIFSIAVGCVVGLCLLRNKRILFLVGFIWGGIHHAPAPDSSELRAKLYSGPFGLPGQYTIASDGKDFFLSRGMEGHIRLSRENRLGLRSAIAAQHGEDSYVFSRWGNHLTKIIAARIDHQPQKLQAWYRGFFLGQCNALEVSTIELFKYSGLMHLLVVSGLHMGIIAWLLTLFVAWPLRLLYTLRIIPPLLWSEIAPALPLVLIPLLLTYGHSVGFTSSSARAVLLVFVAGFGKAYSLFWPLKQRILLAATMQVALYPLGFFSIATAMTWLTYLSVVHLSLRRGSLLVNIWHQFQIMLLGAAFFGQLSFLSLFANLFFTPAIFIISTLGIFNLSGLAELFGLEDLSWLLQLVYLNLIAKTGQMAAFHPWLYLELRDFPGLLAAIIAVSAAFTLNTLRFLALESKPIT